MSRARHFQEAPESKFADMSGAATYEAGVDVSYRRLRGPLDDAEEVDNLARGLL